MRQRLKAFRREDGQALVELAFVLPMLLLFLFAIIEFGLAINQSNSNTDLANITARTLSVLGSKTAVACSDGSSPTTLTAWVDCEAAATGSPKPSSVCVVSGTFSAGNPVTVKVTTTFNWLSLLSGGSGYIGKVVDPQSQLTSSATMRLEQTPASGSQFLSPTCS